MNINFNFNDIKFEVISDCQIEYNEIFDNYNFNSLETTKKCKVFITCVDKTQYPIKLTKKINYYEENYCYINDNNDCIIFDTHMLLIEKNTIYIKIFEENNLNKILIRTFREYLYRFYETKNYISFHAGLIAKNKNNLFVLGESEKGKTTFMIKMSSLGYSIISNDRVLVDQERNVRILPLQCRVGFGTIINNENLYRYTIENYENMYRKEYNQIKLNELRNKELEEENSNRKNEYTIKELNNIYNVENLAVSSMNVIILPDINFDNRNEIYKLSSEEVIDVLEKERRSYKDNLWKEPYLFSNDIMNIDIKNVIKKISENIIIYKVYYDPQFAGKILHDLQKKIEGI